MNAPSSPLAAVRPAIAILGVPFDNVTAADTLRLIGEMIASGKPHYLISADADFVVQSRTDAELRRLLLDAHLALCADRPLLWASRLLGNPLPECIRGADLAPQLLRAAAAAGWRVFLLGGTPTGLARAAEVTQARLPPLQLVGTYAPPNEPLLQMDHAEICRHVREARPDLLLVTLGSPKQEKWIAMHYRSLGVPVSLGTGADWDFLTSNGPATWPQRTGTSAKPAWVFTRAVVQQAWRLRARHRKPGGQTPGRLRPLPDRALQLLQMPAHLDAATVRAEQPLWDRALAASGHLLVDLSQVSFVDSTGVGLLVRLHKVTRAAGQQFALVAPPPVVRQALAWLQLTEVLPSSPNLQAAAEQIARWDMEAIVVVTLGVPHPDEPLAWQGEVSSANIEEVWRMTEPHLDYSVGKHASLTINLAELRFLDSAGVGLMVRARKHARRLGLELRFSAPQPAVLNAIRLLQLEGYLLRGNK